MKICDRHGLDKPKKAVQTLLEEVEGMEYNLCDECILEFQQWASSPPKRKRRNKIFNMTGE
jgi:hypothetical protein